MAAGWAAHPGQIDSSFNTTAVGFQSGYTVNSMAIQPDGKIVIGGRFQITNANTKVTLVNLARLMPTGKIDVSFVAKSINAPVEAVIVDFDDPNDPEIVAGGSFTQVDGLSRVGIVRLLNDGSVDESFSPAIDELPGFNGTVRSLARAPGGSGSDYFVGGDFTAYGSKLFNHLTRLKDDGTSVTGFNEAGTDGTVLALFHSTNGLYIGGSFLNCDEMPRARIARVDGDGFIDAGFNPGTGANATVRGIAEQTAGGDIIVVGDFTTFNGTTVGRIVRLNPMGAVDATFPAANSVNSDGANATIRSVAVQPDGKILIVGDFSTYNGIARAGLARLNADGSLDLTFVPPTVTANVGRNNDIDVITTGEQAYRGVYVAGSFTSFGTPSGGNPSVARVRGGTLPIIITQPMSTSADAGGSASFSVVAVADPSDTDPDPSFTYKWQFNSSDIPGANFYELDLNNLAYNQAGRYRVKVSSEDYTVESNWVTLFVANPFVNAISKSLNVDGIVETNANLNDGKGGRFQLTATSSGSFTGKLTLATQVGMQVYSFKGQFGFDSGTGIATATVAIPNTFPALFLNLQATVTQGPIPLWDFADTNNELTDGVNSAAITAYNNPWVKKVNEPSDLIGYYTVGLEPTTSPTVSEPQGYGYTTINVKNTGAVSVSGRLADGQSFSYSTFIWPSGTIPIFIATLNGNEFVSGLYMIDDSDGSADASLTWVKNIVGGKNYPAGFNLDLVHVAGSGSYEWAGWGMGPDNFLLSADNGNLTPGDGGLSMSPIDQFFTVSADKAKAVPSAPNPNAFKLSLNRNTGVVTGNFVDIGRKATIGGIILGNKIIGNGVFGYFLIPNNLQGELILSGIIEGGAPN